jgi:hypothetical protein
MAQVHSVDFLIVLEMWVWVFGINLCIDWLVIEREKQEGSTKSHVMTVFILRFPYFALMQMLWRYWSSSDYRSTLKNK